MPLFFILTFVVAVLCVLIPALALRILGARWKLEKKIFWRAGIAGIFCTMLILGVVLNIDSSFAGFTKLPDFVQALILGLVTGLFAELGKFLVLDRMLPQVRDRRSAIFFGIGWSGVALLFSGFLIAVGVFGMQNLLNTQDLTAAFPNIDADQLKFFNESKTAVQALVNGPAIKAFTPLLENLMLLVTDVAMTLLIVAGLKKKRTSNVWLAVGLRTVLATSVFFVIAGNGVPNWLPVEAVFAVWIAVMGALALKLQAAFAAS